MQKVRRSRSPRRITGHPENGHQLSGNAASGHDPETNFSSQRLSSSRSRRWLPWLTALASFAALSPSQAQTYYYQMTSAGVSYDISGATIWTMAAGVSSSGTGTFGGFLNVSANVSVLEGISTSSSTLMPQVGDSKTSALPFTSLANAVVTINGSGSYYAFAVDLNEPNNTDSFVSVDTFKIYAATSTSPTASSVANFLSQNPTLIWDMDAAKDSSLLVDEKLTAGSGNANLVFAIPTSYFSALTSSHYLFLHYKEGEFGTFGGKDYGNAGGFEEAGIVTGAGGFTLNTLPSIAADIVPEPGTWGAAIGTSIVVLTTWVRRRNQH